MIKRYNISINSPLEKTFSCFEDEDKIKKWMGGELSTKFKTARDPQNPVGTKFTQEIKNLLKLDGEVIAYQRPILLGIGWKTKGLTGTINYNLSQLSPTTTKILSELEVFDGTSKSKFILELLSPLFSTLMQAQLKGIKKLAEQG